MEACIADLKALLPNTLLLLVPALLLATLLLPMTLLLRVAELMLATLLLPITPLLTFR
jgi:hypothetical protein